MAHRLSEDANANSQAIIGYNAAVMLADFFKLGGKELSGEKLLAALASGNAIGTCSPPTKVSPTNHLATALTSIEQVKNERWAMLKDSPVVLGGALARRGVASAEAAGRASLVLQGVRWALASGRRQLPRKPLGRAFRSRRPPAEPGRMRGVSLEWT